MADHGPAAHGRLLVIEHELDAPAGLLGAWAQARGLTLSTIHLGGGDRLPARLPDCAGVVVLGSEQTAFDDAVPWLHGELSLVRQALADGVPLLGICFGGQVLARALGAGLAGRGRRDHGRRPRPVLRLAGRRVRRDIPGYAGPGPSGESKRTIKSKPGPHPGLAMNWARQSRRSARWGAEPNVRSTIYAP